MYDERIENLIKAALADGMLTEKEKQILFKNAQEQGIDLDEFEMVLDARLVELKKGEKTSAPKSDKLGDVKKCPACGAIVNSFSGTCMDCGYVFENIQANLSSIKLFDLLNKAKGEGERKRIISSFPVPMTKADLLEFISRLHSKVFDVNGSLLSDLELDDNDAYYEKYSECIEKCKMSFSNDSQLSHYVEEFSRAVKRKAADKTGDNIMLCTMGAILVVTIFVFCLCANYKGYGFWGWLGMIFGGMFTGEILGFAIGALVKKIYIKN